MKSSFVAVLLLLLAGLFSRTNDDDAPPLLPLLRLLFFAGIANRGIVLAVRILLFPCWGAFLPLDVCTSPSHEATARFESMFV
jgi:hypothetical protein